MRHITIALALASVTLLAACGGSEPAAPSGDAVKSPPADAGGAPDVAAKTETVVLDVTGMS